MSYKEDKKTIPTRRITRNGGPWNVYFKSLWRCYVIYRVERFRRFVAGARLAWDHRHRGVFLEIDVANVHVAFARGGGLDSKEFYLRIDPGYDIDDMGEQLDMLAQVADAIGAPKYGIEEHGGNYYLDVMNQGE